jgi:1-acyl-sn-glycerol-3-phosphate acyltransferase
MSSTTASSNKTGADKGYAISRWVDLRRRFFRGLFRGVFNLICRVEVEGHENIPTDGAYIIAYNHISLFEPPLLICFWPELPEALAGADVFERPGQNFFVRVYDAIPVKRGEYDRNVIERMIAVLGAGRPLMIAPEGGRSHELGLRRGQPGVAYLMDLLDVPVVPVGIRGTDDHMLRRALKGQRPRLQMRIGEPIKLPPINGRGAERRAMRQANADLVMRRIAELLPARYHGVYADEVA